MVNLSTDVNVAFDSSDSSTSFYGNRVKFALLLVLQIISVPCYLLIFYQIIRKRQIRESHHQHVIILLLISSFIFVTVSLPMTEAYFFTSYVYPSNDTFCTIWTFIHYSSNITNLHLMGFASIERNWLIFHPHLLRTKCGAFLLHYLPLTVCVIFPSAFYFVALFIHQCESSYDYTALLCLWPCYFYNIQWTNLDLYLNNYFPLMSIPIFCIIIYIRVLVQKRSMKQEIFKWRRDKRIILQLWAISSLYLAMWMPLQICVLINAYWDSTFMLQAQVDYMYLFPYIIHLVYPVIVLITYPRLLNNIRVGPLTATIFPTQH